MSLINPAQVNKSLKVTVVENDVIIMAADVTAADVTTDDDSLLLLGPAGEREVDREVEDLLRSQSTKLSMGPVGR